MDRRQFLLAGIGLGSLSGCLRSSTEEGAKTPSSIPATSSRTRITSDGTENETRGFPTFQFDSANSGQIPFNVGELESQEWKFEANKLVSAAVAGGRVFVGAESGQLYALRATDGKPLWSFSGRNIHSLPTVVKDLVLAPTWGGLFALNTETGERLWKVDLINWTPTVTNGLIFGSIGGYGIAAASFEGNIKWTFRKNFPGDINPAPVVANGTVYSSATTGTSSTSYIHALDAKTGAEQWRTELNGVSAPPTLTGNQLIVGTGPREAGSIVALDIKMGNPQWEADLSGRVDASAAVFDGVVYIGTSVDPTLYAFEANTGNNRWSLSVEEGIRTPLVSPERLFVPTEKKLLIIDRQQGEVITQRSFDNPVKSLAITDKWAIVTTYRTVIAVPISTGN